jgi:hypothetical protein
VAGVVESPLCYVGVVEEAVNPLDEFGQGSERAAPDRLTHDDALISSADKDLGLVGRWLYVLVLLPFLVLPILDRRRDRLAI